MIFMTIMNVNMMMDLIIFRNVLTKKQISAAALFSVLNAKQMSAWLGVDKYDSDHCACSMIMTMMIMIRITMLNMTMILSNIMFILSLKPSLGISGILQALKQRPSPSKKPSQDAPLPSYKWRSYGAPINGRK